MTVARLPGEPATVSVTGDAVLIRQLTLRHSEAAAFLRSELEKSGPEQAADIVRRAIPVGLVALSMGTAAVDTGAITRTLDSFAERIDSKSQAALAGLEQAMARLKADEATIAATASAVLAGLPARLDAALAGEAANVRSAVMEATRATQAAGLQQLNAALAQHMKSVAEAVSLDHEGPVRMLRQDLLDQLNGTRRELSDQLASVRSLVETTQAAKIAGAKSSRAVGDDFEKEAMALCREIVTAAGDLFEATGGQPGVGGTTRRIGDGVSTLSSGISGHGPKVRLVLEAKCRSGKPLSQRQLKEEIAAGCRVRDAAGGLVLVPTRLEVPGGGAFCRVDDHGWVVAADDPETVGLIYLIARELVAVLTIRQNDDAEIDLGQIEARLSLALAALQEFDEVGRLAGSAKRALEKLLVVGSQAQQKIRASLTEGMALLHP